MTEHSLAVVVLDVYARQRGACAPRIMARTLFRRVAFQGEAGAFSHAAAEKLIGGAIRPVPCASFADVFEALRKGAVAQAVIPIENTLHGSIHENYDHLVDCGFAIAGETSVRIAHQLITMPSVRLRDVRRVFSHPVALSQCRRFFSENRHMEAVPFYDTAGSVKMLARDQPPQSAAIASAVAAGIYGGVIRKRDIEDDPQNFTRFFLLSKRAIVTRAHGPWKTSLVFSMANESGALFKALACFALRDLTLTKIESRPLRGKPWEYLFYVDFLGSTLEAPVKNALANLAELTELFRVLGCYRPMP